jgi:hypothetical protein
MNRGGFPVVAGKGKAKKEKKQGALHGLGLDKPHHSTYFAQIQRRCIFADVTQIFLRNICPFFSVASARNKNAQQCVGKQEFAQKYRRNVGEMGVWWENYLGYALPGTQKWSKIIYVTHLQVDFINPLGLLYQPMKIWFLLGMPVFL